MTGRLLFTLVGFVLLAAGLVGGTGCGGGSGRVELEGQVTYRDQPVPAGTIYFEPDASKGNDGVQGAATIAHGRYKTTPGFGPRPGPHLVRVIGYDGKPDPQSGEKEGTPLFPEITFPVDIPADTRVLDLDVPVAPKTK